MKKSIPHYVVFRTGGTSHCTWRTTIGYPSRDKALVCAAEVERMGYKAMVKPVSDVLAHGLPVGWEA